MYQITDNLWLLLITPSAQVPASVRYLELWTRPVIQSKVSWWFCVPEGRVCLVCVHLFWTETWKSHLGTESSPASLSFCAVSLKHRLIIILEPGHVTHKGGERGWLAVTSSKVQQGEVGTADSKRSFQGVWGEEQVGCFAHACSLWSIKLWLCGGTKMN